MNTGNPHRLPPEIMSYADWLDYRFNLSHRDLEDLLAERGTQESWHGPQLSEAAKRL